MDMDLKNLLVRTLGTTMKLGVCAVAPLASSRIFYNMNTNTYADVVRELSGTSSPKMAAFIGCAVNILSKDFVDAAEWVVSHNIIEKAVNYFGGHQEAETIGHLSGNDTFIDEPLMSHHYQNMIVAELGYEL